MSQISHFSSGVVGAGGESVVEDCAREPVLASVVEVVVDGCCGLLWSVGRRRVKKLAVTAVCVECGARRSMSGLV